MAEWVLSSGGRSSKESQGSEGQTTPAGCDVQWSGRIDVYLEKQEAGQVTGVRGFVALFKEEMISHCDGTQLSKKSVTQAAGGGIYQLVSVVQRLLSLPQFGAASSHSLQHVSSNGHVVV